MSGCYTYADGSTVPHAQRNLNCAYKLFVALETRGASLDLSYAAARELLLEMDNATGVTR